MTRRVTTYALDADADISAIGIVLGPLDVRASVTRRAGTGRQTLGTVVLNVPGRHNLQNALAAVAAGLELGLPFEKISTGLAEFRGVERRFEVRGEPNGILVVDDYGHHPTEIAAVLAAAKALKRRILVVFQPHRYTRTAALLHEFGTALAPADLIVLADIYGAGEDPIQGVTLEILADAVRRESGRPVELARRVEDVVPVVVRLARPGDVVLTLGAGSIGSVPAKLVEALEKNKGVRA